MIILTCLDIKYFTWKNFIFKMNSNNDWFYLKLENKIILYPSEIIIIFIKSIKNDKITWNFLFLNLLPISTLLSFIEKIITRTFHLLFFENLISQSIMSLYYKDYVKIKKKKSKNWQKSFLFYYMLFCRRKNKIRLFITFLSNLSVYWISGYSLNLLIENKNRCLAIYNLSERWKNKNLLGKLRIFNIDVLKRDEFFEKKKDEEREQFLLKHNISIYLFKIEINKKEGWLFLEFAQAARDINFLRTIGKVSVLVGNKYLIPHAGILNYLFEQQKQQKFGLINVFTSTKNIYIKNKPFANILFDENNNNIRVSQYFNQSLIENSLIQNYTRTDRIFYYNNINTKCDLYKVNRFMNFKINFKYAELLKNYGKEPEILIQTKLIKNTRFEKIEDVIKNDNNEFGNCEKIILKASLDEIKFYADLLREYDPEELLIIKQILNAALEHNFDFEKCLINNNTEEILKFVDSIFK